MNLMTRHDTGDIVYAILSPQREMQITRIEIFLDGGYQYQCQWATEDGFACGWFFERELKEEG